MATWSDIQPGDVVRVYKGTRHHATVFKVTEVSPDPYQRDSLRVVGLTTGAEPRWTFFTKTNGFKAFSIKGEQEFDNEEDD